MSAATVTTVAPVTARISSAVFSSVWRSRATRVTRQPSRASDVAQPRPSPLLAPHSSAALPRIFRSTIRSPEKLSRRPQRNQHHAAQHQCGARQLYRGHGLVQSHPAEKNSGHRTESPDQGNPVCADAAQRLRGDEYGEHGRKNRHGDRYAVYGRGKCERRQRPEQEELRDAKNARDRRGVGGKTDRADPLHHLAAGHEVDGVACRAREAQGCAPWQVRVAVPEQGRHHHRDAGVGEDQRDDLSDARALVQEDDREQDDQRRIQEKDQAAESCGDVLQAQKVDEAREVIPDESQKDDRPDVAPGEPAARGVAPDPGRRREKKGQREDHSQREQRDRIDDVAVGELDQDGAQREAHDARDRHRDADGAVRGRGGHRRGSDMKRLGSARGANDKIIGFPELRTRRSAMAGHSRWANVKHKKAAADATHGKIFTRLIKEVTVAARLGGADPAMNPRLRLAIDKAYDANMPKDTIERAAKRGAGGLEGATYEEIRYEGYGPGGAAVMVDCMSDNRTRTVAEVRHAFAKHGGNLGTDGSVAFLFKHVGQFVFAPGTSEEKVMEAALDAGAEDVVRNDDGSVEVICVPAAFTAVRNGLAKAGLEPALADITMKPTAESVVKGDEGARMQKLLDALENLDDVQEVYTTAVID